MSNKRQKLNIINEIKAILFDMDGVLFDSMPAHARAWKESFEAIGINQISINEFYLYEGQTARYTINKIFKKILNRSASEDEWKNIYKNKTELFLKYNSGKVVDDIYSVLQSLSGIKKTIVTGSSQPSLIEKIENIFPNTFDMSAIITGKDVSIGKPDPEPYLKGLSVLNIKPSEAIVIENAPMGIKSAKAAGIFTIAINTGIIDNNVLLAENPDILYENMIDFYIDIQAIKNNVK